MSFDSLIAHCQNQKWLVQRRDAAQQEQVVAAFFFQSWSPTIVSYNASVVKIYIAMSSLVRLENRPVFIYFKKRSSPPQRRRCSCRDRCYDYLNIFAEKFSEKIGVFDSKQS
jgi:hypothetical protein